jgi:hypothetical protein
MFVVDSISSGNVKQQFEKALSGFFENDSTTHSIIQYMTTMTNQIAATIGVFSYSMLNSLPV